MEWKENRKGMEKKQKSYGTKIKRNGVELERKWNGKFKIEKVNGKQDRNGMEMEWRCNGKKNDKLSGSKI